MVQFVQNPFTRQLDATGTSSGGTVVGPGVSVVGDIATWGDITGTTLADSGVSISTDGTLAANSDTLVSTQKAVKTYVDNSVSGSITGTTTQFAVIVGAGVDQVGSVGPSATAGQVLQSGGGASNPAYSTATFPSTTTINQLLYSSAGDVVSGLATANSAALVTNSTGVPTWSGTMTNGQVVIGSTGATPTAATLTAGTGIGITNGAGAITLNAVGSGLTWSVVTIDGTLAVNTGTIANKAGTLAMALPATSAVGDIIAITGINTATGWQITQAAGQRIFYGTSSTTLGATGTLTSQNIRDSITMVCTVANTTWQVISGVGILTTA